MSRITEYVYADPKGCIKAHPSKFIRDCPGHTGWRRWFAPVSLPRWQMWALWFVCIAADLRWLFSWLVK